MFANVFIICSHIGIIVWLNIEFRVANCFSSESWKWYSILSLGKSLELFHWLFSPLFSQLLFPETPVIQVLDSRDGLFYFLHLSTSIFFLFLLNFSHVYPSTFSSNSECSFFVLGIMFFVAFWPCFTHVVFYVVFHKVLQFNSVQSLSCVRLFAIPWIAARPSLSITNSRSSLRLTSIESLMPSSHLILCRPLLLLPPIPPSIRVFSNESALRIRWPKYWSFNFSISPSNEYPGLISFRMHWLDLLAGQGTLKSLLQHHSS